jgi:membrane protein YdbS with pleckstrin-like domain
VKDLAKVVISSADVKTRIEAIRRITAECDMLKQRISELEKAKNDNTPLGLMKKAQSKPTLIKL